jgi:hypothetical protein
MTKTKTGHCWKNEPINIFGIDKYVKTLMNDDLQKPGRWAQRIGRFPIGIHLLRSEFSFHTGDGFPAAFKNGNFHLCHRRLQGAFASEFYETN